MLVQSHLIYQLENIQEGELLEADHLQAHTVAWRVTSSPTQKPTPSHADGHEAATSNWLSGH
jgi:hypothetical protein